MVKWFVFYLSSYSNFMWKQVKTGCICGFKNLFISFIYLLWIFQSLRSSCNMCLSLFALSPLLKNPSQFSIHPTLLCLNSGHQNLENPETLFLFFPHSNLHLFFNICLKGKYFKEKLFHGKYLSMVEML